MKFLELKNISERYMELVNPTTAEKIIKAGQMAGLKQGARVIDFGCGYAEPLVQWAERFGISGVGLDIRPYACERAEKKVAERGLAGRIDIVCGDAAEYKYEAHSYDVAACIGASFIWGNFGEALRALKNTIRPQGRIVIGEPYWLSEAVPEEFKQQEKDVHTEADLLSITRQEGFDFAYVLHSSHDDWDRYEADNWDGLLRWIEANPVHPERQEVIDHLRQAQAEYTRYGYMYLGWALYVLHPANY